MQTWSLALRIQQSIAARYMHEESPTIRDAMDAVLTAAQRLEAACEQQRKDRVSVARRQVLRPVPQDDAARR
jgi:hypothetical protein